MHKFPNVRNFWVRDWTRSAPVGRLQDRQSNYHGDALADRNVIDLIDNMLTSKHMIRESQRLGLGKHCVTKATALNEVIVLSEHNERRFVQTESDARHVDFILRTLELTK